jgi:hypothetical protein
MALQVSKMVTIEVCLANSQIPLDLYGLKNDYFTLVAPYNM